MDTKRSVEPATAAEAYRQRKQTVDTLLEELHGKLDAHAQRAAREPGNWGYAGSLAHVEEVLRDLVAFMG